MADSLSHQKHSALTLKDPVPDWVPDGWAAYASDTPFGLRWPVLASVDRPSWCPAGLPVFSGPDGRLRVGTGEGALLLSPLDMGGSVIIVGGVPTATERARIAQAQRLHRGLLEAGYLHGEHEFQRSLLVVGGSQTQQRARAVSDATVDRIVAHAAALAGGASDGAANLAAGDATGVTVWKARERVRSLYRRLESAA